MSTKIGDIYKCEVCGNIVEILHEGVGQLVCCNKPMILQTEHTEDPEKGEKHLPVIIGKKVKIGEVPHPMKDDHYIEWIEAKAKDKKIERIFLKPGQDPVAEFTFEPVEARIYCNLHGLWKTEKK